MMSTGYIKKDFSLGGFNFLHLNVRTRFFLDATSVDLARAGLKFAVENNLPVQVLGEGSNVVFTDDFPGLVIKISLQGINLRKDIKETVVEAAAGENWHRLVKFTLARNLYGLENLALIPGSVGAAPVQNIGAYGVELSDVLEGVNVLDRVTAQLQTLSREECELGYRHSIFKTKQSERYIITAIRLKLTEKSRLHTEYGAIRNELQEMGVADVTGQDIYQAVCRVRRRRLPDPEIHANVGSFFKNPIVPSSKYSSLQEQYPEISGTPFGDRVKVSAAWLIENSQLKGIREGGAQVSEQHSLVLINTGGASPADFLRLKDRIQSTLRDQYGLDLEVEPSVISP